jgi:hypothetical protein
VAIAAAFDEVRAEVRAEVRVEGHPALNEAQRIEVFMAHPVLMTSPS